MCGWTDTSHIKTTPVQKQSVVPANMSGVNRAVQLACYNILDRKDCRWNVKSLMYLLQIYVLKAFILKCYSASNLLLVEFILDLVHGHTSDQYIHTNL